MRGPVEVRRPPFCVANCAPSVCQRAQPWSNCHRVYAPQGARSVQVRYVCRKAAGRRAVIHSQGRRTPSRRMHSMAKRPALFQINAFARFLTGALRSPAPFALQPARPFQPACPPARHPADPRDFSARRVGRRVSPAMPLCLLCRLVATPRRSRSRWRSGRWSVGQVERDEAV